MKVKYLLILIMLVGSLAQASEAGAARRASSEDNEQPAAQAEQTAAVAPDVIVSLCLASGSITVRGWERNEVQARSDDAERIELRRGNDQSTGPATRIEVLIADAADGPHGAASSCTGFSDVVLNVPRGAILQLQTRDGDINISDVAEARVEAQSGTIDLAHISRLVEARAMSGDITLKDSSGRIVLVSISGSVEATNLRSVNPGDDFDAGTVSGDLILERVGHAQVQAKSVSGSVNLTGPLVRGGRYDFKTMSGDVILSLPPDASFKVNAKVSHSGEIVSDFTITPTDDTTQPGKGATTPVSPAPPPTAAQARTTASATASASASSSASSSAAPSPRPAPVAEPPCRDCPVSHTRTLERLNGIHGSGDALLNLASFSGTVQLRRR
jgi:hypothetical protein